MEDVDFEQLARTLSGMVGQAVVNETELDGKYDIKLDLAP